MPSPRCQLPPDEQQGEQRFPQGWPPPLLPSSARQAQGCSRGPGVDGHLSSLLPTPTLLRSCQPPEARRPGTWFELCGAGLRALDSEPVTPRCVRNLPPPGGVGPSPCLLLGGDFIYFSSFHLPPLPQFSSFKPNGTKSFSSPWRFLYGENQFLYLQ